MSTSNASWWTPPTASLPPMDGDGAFDRPQRPQETRMILNNVSPIVTSSVIFPPQPPSAAGAGFESGILTVKLHCAYRIRQPSTPELTDERPIYALFDCEGFQLSARAAWWGGKRGNALWADTFHFDVTTCPDLVIHFSARNDNAPVGQPIEPRGYITISPLPDGYPVGKLLVDIEDGTGQVEVMVSYHQQKVPNLEDWNAWEFREVKHANFVHVTRKNTGRIYAMTAVQLGTAGIALVSEKAKGLGPGICHPLSHLSSSLLYQANSLASYRR
ncbi:hypothetical protein PFICI_03575 [Pestalotiopsis fici W106-1]|uniref:C2 domain-containing protein n=1 Tax=Pestalotiopsis fici (strain W106-1 / CGMCC3.15140) TaxID=1229662 RepID=W3XHP5_PESFW|nr:uncharacterized protein PFICI_03575 [Pestalotiopsis fici W106-1]ETS85550.1 hypothetical protein PFICI_03575 [Pestalotiopsis fici W106-1]